nr:retrovirus-related Pol polyprotein from transposon TNT 1-94 [Tanacetum cinerariifolium]
MVESSSPDITPKEEHVTLDRPESPNPFIPAIQQSIAMSSAEAEYVAAAGCYANILWMKSQLTDYDIIYEK